MAAADLPVGFKLDESVSPAELPAGFALDTAKPATPAVKKAPTLLDALKQSLGIMGSVFTSANPVGAVRLAPQVQEDVKKATEHAGYVAGGAVTDVLANNPRYPVSPETAAKAGFAANVGVQAIPTVLGAAVGAGAVQKPIEQGAHGLMRHTLGATREQLTSGAADRAATTMLKEGYNVTTGGIAKMRDAVTKLHSEIDDIVGAASKSGTTVNKFEVSSRLEKVYGEAMKAGTPQKDLREIEKIYNQFMTHPMIRDKEEIPAALAMTMKRAIYKKVDDAYGSLGTTWEEAQKSLARGFKEDVVKAIPEIKKLSKDEAALMNAIWIAERRAWMSGNRQMGGLAWLSNKPAAAAAFLATRSELFKSALARMMDYNARAAAAGTGAIVGEQLVGKNLGTAPETQ